MSDPGIQELLPPPPAPAKPFPWRPLLALFVPAAGLAAGTGLQRLADAPGDAVLQWLCWSSAAGLLVGLAVGFARRRGRLPWAAYGAAAPWMAAGLVFAGTRAVRPLREALADRREARCRAEGRPVCTMAEFTRRCAQAHAEPARGPALLGRPRNEACNPRGCTREWLYPGPFRPEQHSGPGALACFVMTDAQGRGVRHWLMAAELPAN